jgi:hypothetical protein
MSLTSRMSMELRATYTSALDLTTASAPLAISQQWSLGSGTGAGAADKVWSDRRTLAASATEDLDLAGVLTDAFGATVTLARVKGLFIRASAANSNNVVVGAADTNAWATLLNSTGTLTFRPGAAMLFTASTADATTYAVTAATGDLLKVANSGAGSTVTYDIAIIGASA